MEGLELAKFKDEISKYVFEEIGQVSSQELGEKFEDYGCSEDFIIGIMQELGSYRFRNRKIMDYYFDGGYVYLVSPEPALEEFINSGGFVAEESKLREAAIKINESSLQDNRIKDLTEENLNLKVKTHWIPILISGVAAGFAIASYFKTAPEPKSNEEQLEQMEQRLDSIESRLHKEVGSLKGALQKAEQATKKEIQKNIPQ